jgi:hypothetical protein
MPMASWSRLCGVKIGATVLRWAPCLGSSMAMNMGRRNSGRASRMVMPPRLASEEKTPWLVSTCMMSL